MCPGSAPGPQFSLAVPTTASSPLPLNTRPITVAALGHLHCVPAAHTGPSYLSPTPSAPSAGLPLRDWSPAMVSWARSWNVTLVYSSLTPFTSSRSPSLCVWGSPSSLDTAFIAFEELQPLLFSLVFLFPSSVPLALQLTMHYAAWNYLMARWCSFFFSFLIFLFI